MRKREPESKRIGIWLRVSTEDQVRGESPETHEKRARLYADAKGWSVVEVYRLDAVSGKTVKEHPEAKRMLADVRRGQITGLVFSKLARLGRNTKELLEFSEHFQEHDADLISLAEAIDTSSPAGRLFFSIIAAMAQWEREEISARVAASVPIRAKMGKPLGGAAPYGYRWDNKHLVIDEKEAPVRKLIYELFLEHKRKKSVARVLNDRGLRTRNGSKWSDTTIDRLLRDSSAKGLRRANYSTSRGDGKAWELKPKDEWVIHEVPAIVSEHLWDSVNAILGQQKQKEHKPARKVVHLFAGLTFCACGPKMLVPSNSAKYTCPRCRNKMPAEDLEDVFHNQLREYLLSEDDIRKHREQGDQKVKEGLDLLQVLESERARLSAEVDKLYGLFQSGAIDARGFGDKYKPLSERLTQLDDEIPRTQAETDVLRITLSSQEEVLAEARNLFARWPKLSQDEKRSVVETIVEKIVISEGHIDIKLAHDPPVPPSSSGSSGEDPSSPSSGTHNISATHRHPGVAQMFITPVTLKSLKPNGFPERARNPQTLGQHLLARRLSLRRYQRDVAKTLGVNAFTVLNWEKDRTEPAIRHYPAILAFLGYDPFPPPVTLADRLKAKRRALGLSIDALAAQLGVDPSTVADWERSKTVLLRTHRRMLVGFLRAPALIPT